MKRLIDKNRFGPWALVTGASSGIGREFARQIAASGINVVLVARREALLDEIGKAIAKDFEVQYRTVVADLSQAGFLENLAKAIDDLDIGLVVSNAGTGNPGEFLKIDREVLESLLRLNTLAHLDIAHHFGQKLASRGRGGLLLVGALGASNGLPHMANDGGAKAYVHSLGEALHIEFKPLGVQVTVLQPGFIDTPVLVKFGLNPDTMPTKPMKVEQCVSEALGALEESRSMIALGTGRRDRNP
jgi:short-subunit dehydrogenase